MLGIKALLGMQGPCESSNKYGMFFGLYLLFLISSRDFSSLKLISYKADFKTASQIPSDSSQVSHSLNHLLIQKYYLNVCSVPDSMLSAMCQVNKRMKRESPIMRKESCISTIASTRSGLLQLFYILDFHKRFP